MTSDYDHKLNELKRFIPFLEKTIRILVKTCPDLTTSRKANLNKLKYLRDLLVNQNKRTTIEYLLEYEKLLTKLYETIQPKVNISSIYQNVPTERQKSDFEEAKPDVSADKSRATEAEVVCTFSSKEPELFQLRASKGSMSPTLYSAEKSLMKSSNDENRDLNMPQGSPDMAYSKNNTNIKSCDTEDLLRKESQFTEDLNNAETEENLEGIRKEKIEYAELTDNVKEEKEMFTVKHKSDLNTLYVLREIQQNTPKTGSDNTPHASHDKKADNSSKMCDFIAVETTIQLEDNISGICKTMEKKQKSDLEATSIEVNLITKEKAKPDISEDKSRSTEGKFNCSFNCGEPALFQRRSNNGSLSPELCFTEKSLKKSSNEVNLNLNIPQGTPNTDYAKNKNNTNIKSCYTEDLLREASQITKNLTTAEREIGYEELTESEGEEKETFAVKQKSDSNALSELEENQLNVPKTESDASNNKNVRKTTIHPEDSISDYCRTIPLEKQQKLDFEASRIKLNLITKEATNVIAAHKSGVTMAEVICSSSSEEPALFQRRSNKSTMSPKLCSTEKSDMKSFKHSPENTIGHVTQDLVSPENHSSNRNYKQPLFVRRSAPRTPRKQSPFNHEKNTKKSSQDENQAHSSTNTGVGEQDYVRERKVEIECIELTDSGSEEKEIFEVNNKADLNALSEFGDNQIQPDKRLYAPSNKEEENYAKTCDIINVTEKSYRETGEDIETYNMQTDNVSICMTTEKQNNVNDTCNDIASKEPSKANKILKERVVSEIDILQALKNDILNETLPIPAAETKTPALHQPITTKVLSSKKKISVAIYKEKILKTNFVPLFPNVSPKNTADKINLTQQTPTLPFTSPSLVNIGEGTTTPIHIYKSFDGPVTTNNNLIIDKSKNQSNWSNQYNYAQMTGSQFHEQNNAPSTQSHPFDQQDLQITTNYRNNLPIELGYPFEPFEHNVATMPSMITARQNNEKMAPTNYYCQNNTQMAPNPTFEQNNALMTPIPSSSFGNNYPPMTPIPIFGRNNLSMTSTITQTQRGHNFEENRFQRDRDERKLNKNNMRNQNRAWVFERQRRPYFRNVNMLPHNRSRTNYAKNSLYTRNQRQKERSHNVRRDREGKGFDDFNQRRARSMKRQMKEYYSNKEKESSMQRNTPSKCNKKLSTGRLETKNEKIQQLGNSVKRFVIPKIGDQVKKVTKTEKTRPCGISSDSENDTATVRRDTRFPSQISVENKRITVASPGICSESDNEKTNKRNTCKNSKMNPKPNEEKNISKNEFRPLVPRKEPDINQEDLNDSLKTLSNITSGTEKDTEKTEIAAKFHREKTSESKKSAAISARGTKRTKKGIISSDSDTEIETKREKCIKPKKTFIMTNNTISKITEIPSDSSCSSENYTVTKETHSKVYSVTRASAANSPRGRKRFKKGVIYSDSDLEIEKKSERCEKVQINQNDKSKRNDLKTLHNTFSTLKASPNDISSGSGNDKSTIEKAKKYRRKNNLKTKKSMAGSPVVAKRTKKVIVYSDSDTEIENNDKKYIINSKPNKSKNYLKSLPDGIVPKIILRSKKKTSDSCSGSEYDAEKTETPDTLETQTSGTRLPEVTKIMKGSDTRIENKDEKSRKGKMEPIWVKIDKKINKLPREEPDIKQCHSKNRSDNLELPSDDVVIAEVNPLKNTKEIKSKIADNLSTCNYDTAVILNENADQQSGLQLNKPEHTSDKPQTNKLKTKQCMSKCEAIGKLKLKIITNRSCRKSKQNINENKVNNTQIGNQQSLDIFASDLDCFTDKEYCFQKDVSRYQCRLCQYIGNDIVKHYKTKHPHCEVPLSRMHPDIAQEAIDQSERVNIQVISKMPSENYTCRFCFEEFNETNNNLERFFSHIVSSHTGEYRQDMCSECVDVTNCPMNRDIIPPPKNTKGQLFGYICRECYFTQISLANLKRHVISRHDEQTEICIINMAVMSNETIEAFKHQHDLRSRKSVEAQHCSLKIPRSNVSLTEINDNDNSNQVTTSIQKLPQSSAQQSIDTRLSFQNDGSSVNAKLSNDSSEVKIELQVKKVPDNGELSTSEYKNISPPENKSKSKEINKQNTSDDSVVVYPHFKINFNEAGNKEYVCCINGTDNHYKTTLLVSMKTHIQTKHSENWDGYCFICRAIVTPQGKHFFKECFQHCLDQHIDSFPILENIISGDCNAPTETLKPTKHRVDVNELLSEHKMINNEYDMLPKFEREVSLGSPVHTKIEPPKLSPIFENRRTQPSEDPFSPSKYEEEAQAEIMSQKYSVVLKSMMSLEKLVQIFKCAGRFCSFTTDSADAALLHASTHQTVGGENAMKCSYCVFDPSGNAIDLVTHVFKAHGSCPYACGLCFYRASSSQLVGAHIERFHQQPVAAGSVLKTKLLASPAADNTGLLPRETAVAEYVCKNDYPDCKFRTYIAETFIDHLSKHNSDRIFSCFMCDVKAASPVELVTHLKTHGLKRYQCTWCVHGADNETELLFHASEKHPSKQPQAYLRVKEEIKDNEFPTLVYLNESKVAFQEVAAACESENPERDVDRSINLQNLIESIYKAKGPTNTSTMTTIIPNKPMAPIKNEQVESVPSQSIEQICLDGSDEDSVGPNLSQKMTNSQPSECQVNQERSIPSRKASSYPRYVPDPQRRACGAPACCFISVDNDTFKQHWDTHHSATTHFKCQHCPPTQKLNTSQQLNAARILAHLKMHDEALYACSDCTYYHFRRRAVEKHNADAHAGAGRVLVVREEAPPDPAPAPAHPPPAPTMDLKPWQCGFCQFKSMLRQQVVEHCTKEHQFKMQYKCAYCPYRASTFENVPKHQTNSHPNSPEDVIHFYYREDSVPDAADGTPRWVRQRQKMNLSDVKTEAAEPAAPELLSVLTSSESSSSTPTRDRPSNKLNIEKDKTFEDISKEMLSRFGQFCDPFGLRYKCPLCKVVMADSKEVMQAHLFEELQYRRWSCSICSYKAFHKIGLNEHMSTEHARETHELPIALPTNVDIETWVAKLLEHQFTIINRNRDKLDAQRTDKQQQAQTSGVFSAPVNKQFSCPNCPFTSEDEKILENHIKMEMNNIGWKCNAPQFHCNSHREPARPVEVSREPLPGTTGMQQRMQLKSVSSTIQDLACQSQGPLVPSDVLENCLPFGRYEESGPNPKVPLTVRNRSASEDGHEEDRLLIDESSQDQPSLIRCKYCVFKTFYRQNMLSHTLRHYNLKPYKCGYCDYNGHRKSTFLHTKQVHPQLQPLVVSMKEPSGPPLILKLKQKKTGKRFAVQKRH